MGKFTRRAKNRYYRSILYVVSEGKNTETTYFCRLQSFAHSRNKHIAVIPPGPNTSPKGVLQRLEEYLKSTSLSKDDELWCVIDQDQWPDTHIDMLYKWCASAEEGIYRGVALSKPKFEIWLLAHFEDLKQSNTTSKAVVAALGTYLHEYDKTLGDWKPTEAEVRKAIERAKQFTNGVYGQRSGTTMWELAEHIFE